MMNKEKRVLISIVLPKELKTRLKRIAKQKRKSVSSLVNEIIDECFEKIEKLNKEQD